MMLLIRDGNRFKSIAKKKVASLRSVSRADEETPDDGEGGTETAKAKSS